MNFARIANAVVSSAIMAGALIGTPWQAFAWEEKDVQASIDAHTRSPSLLSAVANSDLSDFGGVGADANPLNRPDLTIEKFWIEVDGNGLVYFNWLVRNIGKSPAPSTHLTVMCKQLASASCPWGDGTYTHDVRPLMPAKTGVALSQDFAAGEVISLAMNAPTVAVKFRFTASVDTVSAITEAEESNNNLITLYHPVHSMALTSESAYWAAKVKDRVKRGTLLDAIENVQPGNNGTPSVDPSRPGTDKSSAAERRGPDDGAGSQACARHANSVCQSNGQGSTARATHAHRGTQGRR